MILDTSGSMFGVRMDRLKEAAQRVVSTLTVGDRVTIVPFSTQAATPLTDEKGYMLIATEENKKILLQQIDALEAEGRTNFYDAFTKAFDVLDQTAKEERTVSCNTAILFLTDGEMTEPLGVTDQDLVDLVSSRINATSSVLRYPVVLFTYSVSEQENVHALPSKLACSTEWGVWSKITVDSDIVDGLSSYYRLFALGLGSDRNEKFVAWVEPYVYSTGGVLGTTVSVPVYDRSKQPHVFLGVAAVDLHLAALDAALGVAPGRGSQESIDRIADISTATCPILQLDLCELESFRRQGAPKDEALCTNSCAEEDFVQVEEESCPFGDKYPSDLWVNNDNAGLTFEDRVCCVIGQTVPSDQCPAGDGGGDDSSNKGAIIGGAVAGGVVFLLCIGVFLWLRSPLEEVPPDPVIELPTMSEDPRNREIESVVGVPVATAKDPSSVTDTNGDFSQTVTEDHDSA